MHLRKRKIAASLVMAVTIIGMTASGWSQPQSPAARESREPQPIPAEQFDKLHLMIKPQPGELRFHEIPWVLSVWEARQKAAAEGKPILVWSGSGGAPIGVC
jgi:hypothetical protein